MQHVPDFQCVHFQGLKYQGGGRELKTWTNFWSREIAPIDTAAWFWIIPGIILLDTKSKNEGYYFSTPPYLYVCIVLPQNERFK